MLTPYLTAFWGLFWFNLTFARDFGGGNGVMKKVYLTCILEYFGSALDAENTATRGRFCVFKKTLKIPV